MQVEPVICGEANAYHWLCSATFDATGPQKGCGLRLGEGWTSWGLSLVV